GHHGILGVAGGRARGDPAADQLVLVGTDFHALAAGVRHLTRRLQEQQAVLGGVGQQPPTACFLDQRVEIDLWHEGEQGEGEAVLPAGLAVTAARVATQFGKDRYDLVGEVDRQTDVTTLCAESDGRLPVAVGGGDGGAAVGQRNDSAEGGDARDLGVGDFVVNVAGEILRAAAG